jgi:hypothetical protein
MIIAGCHLTIVGAMAERVFGEPTRGSMLREKCLRPTLVKWRVAQPHR